MGLIRLLLAVAVFNSHFPVVDFPLLDGHEAVLTFFAISGFYMALILDIRYEGTRRFYLSRFVSLYPMYVFALALSVGMLVNLDIHPMTTRSAMAGLMADPAGFVAMVWTSVFVVGQELLFSLAPTPGGGLHFIESSRSGIWTDAPLVQAWSLSLEITFYAMAPWLVRLRTTTLATMAACSLALKLAFLVTGLADIVFFKRFFPAEFWLFGSGILAYRAYRRLPDRASGLDCFAFMVLAGLVMVADDVPDGLEPFFLPAAALCATPFIFRGFGRFRFDAVVGKVAYPFYLLHFTVIAIYETYYEEPVGWHVLVAALCAAVLTHLLFNPGIEHLKRVIRNGRMAPAAQDMQLTAQRPTD